MIFDERNPRSLNREFPVLANIYALPRYAPLYLPSETSSL